MMSMSSIESLKKKIGYLCQPIQHFRDYSEGKKFTWIENFNVALEYASNTTLKLIELGFNVISPALLSIPPAILCKNSIESSRWADMDFKILESLKSNLYIILPSQLKVSNGVKKEIEWAKSNNVEIVKLEYIIGGYD